MKERNRISRADFLRVALYLGLGLVWGPEGKEPHYFNWLNDNPPSLMLHSKDWRQIPELIPLAKEYFYPMTYVGFQRIRDYKDEIAESLIYPSVYGWDVCRYIPSYYQFISRKPPLVISIDDVGTSWIRREHLEIFRQLKEAEIPAVIGLQPNQEIGGDDRYWNVIKDLHQAGWETGSHTITHPYLPGISEERLRWEIEESAKRIQDATGESPISLIAPFGEVSRKGEFPKVDERILRIANASGYKFVVGIADGRRREETGGVPEYLGRVPPGLNANVTLQYLLNFN